VCRLVVVLQDRTFVYDLNSTTILEEIETVPNTKGKDPLLSVYQSFPITAPVDITAAKLAKNIKFLSCCYLPFLLLIFLYFIIRSMCICS